MNREPGYAANSTRAVAAAVITFALLAACGPTASGLASSPTSSHEPPVVATPTAFPSARPAASSAGDGRPAWVADLDGQLDCIGPNNQIGQEVPAEFGPVDPAPTPEGALDILLRNGLYAWLPAGGFEPPHVDGAWAQHRYLVDGNLKAIAIGTNGYPGIPESLGWDIVGLRACDPSEFDPADGLSDGTILWLDAAGDAVPTGRIFSRPGAGHCGWEGVTFLHMGDALYLRDPDGVLADQTALPFRRVKELPSDAVDAELHAGSQRLFQVADPRAVYVRYDDGTIERWGRAFDQIGCM